jgi:glucosylglycerol-phosphate synthase
MTVSVSTLRIQGDGQLDRIREAGTILATDLDGTLLGGTDRDRCRLGAILAGVPEGTGLVFTTGRGLETVLPVLNDPLVPTPDVIVADVGATVVRTSDLEPVQPLQTRIASRWPGTQAVLESFTGLPGLVRQDVPQERRCSFVVEDRSLLDGEIDRLARRLGCYALLSAGRYLDVLPRGVSKGATLAGLLHLLDVEMRRVVVAGDTLNDLSLFEIGARGIVVGNAESGLVRRVKSISGVFVAAAEGAAGICEGLVQHGVVSDRDLPDQPPLAPDPGDEESQLVMVYHRLPFDEVRRGGLTHRRRPKSPNGIIPTLLGFFDRGRSGSWVAWSKQERRAPRRFEETVEVDARRYPNLVASRIPLTTEDVKLFYERFAKDAFWPIIFSFPSKAVFDESHWEHYVGINALFAERVAREARPGALVWIHDYNLWMVPGQLRRLRPDLRISFFHHTAFPSPDVFTVIPWYREIVGSLLQCDYVGFHVPRYVENFANVVRAYAPSTTLERISCAPRFITYGCALGEDMMTTRLEVEGRTVRMGAHPVGCDVKRIGRFVDREATQRRIESLRREIGRRRCILSLERLDYVKGQLERMDAFERLLDAHPELHGEVVLVSVVTPPAPGMKAYRSIRGKVDQAVGRINGRFGRLDWTPVRYFYRSLPFEEVVAHYGAADVAWISPLRDGLNLVAKEYVATKGSRGEDGVVILSEYAGAAVELHGALLTNPYDAASMERDLHHALTMDEAERAHRMSRMLEIVRTNDVVSWGIEFLEQAEQGSRS